MTIHSHRARAAESETERAVRRLLEAAYGAGELGEVDELVAPDYVGYWAGTGDVVAGRGGVKTHAAQFRLAFGRMSLDVEAVEVDGAAFEARWTARGRLERPFLGVEPSGVIGAAGEEPHGPAVTLSGIARGTVRAGQLVESATAWTLEGADFQAAAGFDEVPAAPAPVAPPAGPVPASSARR